MTTVDELSLPSTFLERTPRTRAERILDHGITVDLTWWNARLAERGLPGGPVTGLPAGSADDQRTTSGRAVLTRGDLFALAGDDTPEGTLRLLWHTLAWGSGLSGRNNLRRLDSVRADIDGSARLLRRAATLAGEHPAAGYALLLPGDRRAAIAHLGSAFFTKFLYFAGGGAATHQALILDSVVAGALRGHGWSALGTVGSWPAVTYGRYCALLGRWATAADVHPDEIEHWLFRGR
ncbi:hypothetical protein R8Z50_08695 [Longispora sp. K20-0274]|uniref:8-oxoguanine DNA glycosylase OGG fold protein n=1 Tax=Longispora sp. K20-0274 TaxID=3088255 RepID=UPI00399AB1AE